MEAPSEITSMPSTGRSGFPRSVLLVGGAIVALVVVALIVAVARPNQPTTYAAGTPEATFQDFYKAWQESDVEAAYGHLSSSVTKELTLAGYRRLDAEQSWQRDQDRRLVLLGADVSGDRATLHIRVDQSAGGGLGGDRYSSERSVRLARENGTWCIDEPLVGIESVAYGY
jgi:hypothetical protein